MEETQEILLQMGFENPKNNVWRSKWFGFFLLAADSTPEQLGQFIHNRSANGESIIMLKDWFTESDDGEGGKMLMAECPNCHDTVVYNDGCIKCEANFKFK